MHSATQPLLDSYGRRHNSLRVSVTDRCNIRCRYCMPAKDVQFQPREQLLTFEEITDFVRVATRLGIDSVRLTGGEPLVRTKLDRLIGMLSALSGIKDLSLTTNGILLPDVATALRASGLQRLNISLDAIDRDAFQDLTRFDALDRAIDGIDAALQVGFDRIRINAIAIRGITESQIPGLVKFARARAVELRFIEFMPLDADHAWNAEGVLTGAEIRTLIEQDFGPMQPTPRPDQSQPAVDFELADGTVVGFINPVSEPFCGDCNRLRLTADGNVRNCLFAIDEWDAKAILRGSFDDNDTRDRAMAELIRDCVAGKRAGHGIDDPEFVRPKRTMYQIGG